MFVPSAGINDDFTAEFTVFMYMVTDERLIVCMLR